MRQAVQVAAVKLLSVCVFTIIVLATAAAEACSGCGCRGGPGYRGSDGKCVGWANIGKMCGSPPTTRCTAEGPNVGAEEAADHGVKALEAKRPK